MTTLSREDNLSFSRMVTTITPKMLLVYGLLMILIQLGYARYETYFMDGDGTSFLDISQYIADGHARLALNGYWNPGYPAVLAVMRWLIHPTLMTEYKDMRYTNVLIFVAAMAACFLFTTALTTLRRGVLDADRVGLPDGAVHLVGQTLLLMSAGRELTVAAPQSDTLLATWMLLAMGLLLWWRSTQRAWLPVAVGFALGAAYLTKSFAFIPSVLLLIALFVWSVRRPPAERTRFLTGSCLAAVVFAAMALPYALAISRQLGHLTTGDSARMNFCFFVDQTPRWHEWFHHDLGHAGGVFQHPEQVIAANPTVFSFAAHPQGTFPLWFDPAYWTFGLTPHFWLQGELHRLVRCTELLVRFLMGRAEPLVLLGVLFAFGASWRARKTASVWFAPLGWGLLMFCIYFPVDLQDRYLTSAYMLILLPLFACVGLPAERRGITPSLGAGAAALLALVIAAQAAGYLVQTRRLHSGQYEKAGMGQQVYGAAQGLIDMGVRPGAALACFGPQACYVDHYWARLTGGHILAQVDAPEEQDPELSWTSPANTVRALQAQGVVAVVSKFENSVSKPQGWVQLGNTDYFAYPIQSLSGGSIGTRK